MLVPNGAVGPVQEESLESGHVASQLPEFVVDPLVDGGRAEEHRRLCLGQGGEEGVGVVEHVLILIEAERACICVERPRRR